MVPRAHVVLFIVAIGCRDRDQPPPSAPPTQPPPARELATDARVVREEPARPPLPPIPPPADVAQPPASAATTASGVATVVLERGTGKAHPVATSVITVEYTAWTASGAMFDSSVQRGAPETLPLSSAPRAWQEAVMQMVAGEKRRLWIPANVAAVGTSTPTRGDIVYDVKLLAIAAPPVAPPAVVPADATLLEHGIAVKWLAHGKGTTHPTETTMVVAHLSQWNENEELVESTLIHGRPAERPLADFPTAVAVVLRRMVVGDKVRVWSDKQVTDVALVTMR